MRQLAPDGNAIGNSRDGSTGRSSLRPLLVWAGLTVLLVVPWFSWQTHPHWDRVEWTLVPRAVKTRDVIANVLLYVPFGYWALRRWPGKTGRTLLLALVLSLVTELTQVYSHGRFPNLRDVVFNVLGAWLGCGLVRKGVRLGSDWGQT